MAKHIPSVRYLTSTREIWWCEGLQHAHTLERTAVACDRKRGFSGEVIEDPRTWPKEHVCVAAPPEADK